MGRQREAAFQERIGRRNEYRALKLAKQLIASDLRLQTTIFKVELTERNSALDLEGRDIRIFTNTGRTAIQVKSSVAGMEEFERKSQIPCIVVNSWRSDEDILPYLRTAIRQAIKRNEIYE